MRRENILNNLDRIDKLLLLVRARMAAMMQDGATGTLSVKVPFSDGGVRRVFLAGETTLQVGREEKKRGG